MLVVERVELGAIEHRPEVVIFDDYHRCGTHEQPESSDDCLQVLDMCKDVCKRHDIRSAHALDQGGGRVFVEKVVQDVVSLCSRVCVCAGRLDAAGCAALLTKEI